MTDRAKCVLTTFAAVVVLAGIAPVASAVGFGPVRSLSPATGIVDQIDVAIAPTGETAVMWRQGGPDDFQFVAAIGPDAESLGPATPVEAARGRASQAAGARLFARPRGGFVACFHGEDRGADAFGCSFTDGSGTFGPLRVVERRPGRGNPTYELAMRSDGKLAILLGHRVANGKRLRLRTTTLDDQGRRGPVRPFATVRPESSANLATTDDGITAVALAEPRRRNMYRLGRPSLRLTAPGQDVFGAPKRFLPGRAVKALRSIGLDGGRELRMVASDGDDHIGGDVIVRRRANGSFTAPFRLPRPAPGFLGGTVVTLPGSPLAVTAATRESQTDCSNVSAGVVGSGPLVSRRTTSRTTTTQRLSKPGQIAFQPTAATLADGTVIAAWQNGVTASGDTRLEVAIRPSKASRFRPSQVLPELATWGMDLAAGGSQAIVAWMVGDHVDGPSHVVVSSLRQAPPYAPAGQLPKRPRMPCQ